MIILMQAHGAIFSVDGIKRLVALSSPFSPTPKKGKFPPC
jgi:hypothetical protein